MQMAVIAGTVLVLETVLILVHASTSDSLMARGHWQSQSRASIEYSYCHLPSRWIQVVVMVINVPALVLTLAWLTKLWVGCMIFSMTNNRKSVLKTQFVVLQIRSLFRSAWILGVWITIIIALLNVADAGTNFQHNADVTLALLVVTWFAGGLSTLGLGEQSRRYVNQALSVTKAYSSLASSSSHAQEALAKKGDPREEKLRRVENSLPQAFQMSAFEVEQISEHIQKSRQNGPLLASHDTFMSSESSPGGPDGSAVSVQEETKLTLDPTPSLVCLVWPDDDLETSVSNRYSASNSATAVVSEEVTDAMEELRSLSNVLRHPVTLVGFQSYLMSIYDVENLHFLQKVYEFWHELFYQADIPYRSIVEKLKWIEGHFVRANSEQQVNVSESLQKSVETGIQEWEHHWNATYGSATETTIPSPTKHAFTKQNIVEMECRMQCRRIYVMVVVEVWGLIRVNHFERFVSSRFAIRSMKLISWADKYSEFSALEQLSLMQVLQQVTPQADHGPT